MKTYELQNYTEHKVKIVSTNVYIELMELSELWAFLYKLAHYISLHNTTKEGDDSILSTVCLAFYMKKV